ncbi:hypothetical protein [Williamsia sterculiae]|uniref:Uncharacterized protein n=1 Tax=Williamsia sterculiae TaxID=1344003 RepID=A0A1N7DLZ5_9NOCA|nr:hypothetical protein [Williamsia sterculiae]SIR76847.1 hypothetical protein SAMN05445060_0751 [Williamsia sterculiae]
MTGFEGPEFPVAARYAGIVVVAAVIVLVAGAVSVGWIRTIFGVVGPLAILGGALGAGLRAYRAYQQGRAWQVWQGAMWFLLVLFLVALGSTFGLLTGG